MSATVHIQDDSIALLADGIPIGSRRPLSDDACAQLAGFARRYTLLEHHRDPRAARALGQELYRWLDGEQQGLSRLLEGSVGTLLLTLHCPSRHPTAAEWAALQAPWELLANAEGHLAADPLLQFALVRRLGPIQTAPAPDDYRLALAFMAAAPDGVSELDYEAEEAAILSAVGNTQLDLLVEESGEAQTLGRRLAEAGGLPVLHLSCHGHAAWRVQQDATPQPVLLLEDDAGAAHPTSAPELLRALRPALPRLLFLSACSSAAAPSSPAHSLTSALIGAGLPAIIGWDGPVADSAATQFAAELYARLACSEVLALAVAEARRRLLESESDSLRRDWHLARLWLGPQGDEAAPLVAGTRARSLLPADYVPGELLGKKDLFGNAVPVASHALFVGRRRELQRALRALRDLKGQHHAGVLITGMGRLGKSSLAARLANRCRDDLALAVLHGRFGLEDLLERLDDTLAPYPAARELIRQGQTQVRAARARGEDAALQALGDLLTDLLSGPCRQHDASGPALLLVLDDFEQLLDERAGVRTVQARSVGLITTLMRAFDPLRTTSRLLVTSRFPFRLGPPGADPAERLARLELASFNDTAERKLTLRQQTLARLQTLPDLEAREALIPRARAAARGNPGLLDLLSARLVLNPKVPLATATAALEQMESYLAGGDLPTSEELRAQLEAIAVQSLLDLAGSDGRALLRALTLFALPVPSAIATGLATELGGDLEVLRDLALLEPGADPVLPGETGVRLSPLAAARFEPLTDTEAAALAPLVAQPLFATWGGEAGGRPAVAELQLTRLALAAKDVALAAHCGDNAIRALEAESYPEAARLGSTLVDLLEDTQTPFPPRLLASAARALRNSGDGEAAERLLSSGSAVLDAGLETLDPMDAGHLLMEQADRARTKGELARAETLFQQAAVCAERADNPISAAIARGRIADILQARGQLDEALRIRTEEQLPVYERLGDVRSKAVTQGQIADILQARGQLEEALRIRTEEELPVYERLGDVRLKAVTQGQIADILQARGQLDEALRIRTEEELPVYERLGDVHAKAVTQGKIADILGARGQLEEALRIRTEEELPVYERLGDVREKAVTQGQIADILQARGQLEEALRIRTEEQLPVYERLGDVRSLLVCRAMIALNLLARNDSDDRQPANTLLCLALTEAQRLGLPEAGQIEQLLNHFEMDCGGSPLQTNGAADADID
ncbi:CHAT domain-containing protein [Rhabdochromatium marinum]|uniref:CHAT domain-containing protein n=1 Tax=Rhabdochromatium marinum TaxID=48729 RepID=UPI0019042057|nr:CHAT domain-containing protein [Rhabdochromatium marinum]MBK1648466.1 hypothetical protein [Rhabdochromatium marinum]